MDNIKNIFPESGRLLSRSFKEGQLGQNGHVFLMYGLSGSGKTTIADVVERLLSMQGYHVKLLDGDNLRSGLNNDLGFSDSCREENIRRISEVSKLFLDSGIIVLCSFICPKKDYRNLAQTIIGDKDFTKVYIKASYETCFKRDVKGLYAKAKGGDLKDFTGKESIFEPPDNNDNDWVLDTEKFNINEVSEKMLNKMLPLIKKK